MSEFVMTNQISLTVINFFRDSGGVFLFTLDILGYHVFRVVLSFILITLL